MKKTIITGLQPTGNLTIGNYIGSIRQMEKLQNEYNSYIFIADLHALTTISDGNSLHKNIRQLIALYLACGIDPDKNTIYLQSENEYTTNISWMFECLSYYGQLTRMIQFKEKSKKSASFNVGLLTYPVLMAADILEVDADLVPVGIDQKQHVELTRDLAERFNNKYGDVFTLPEPLISTSGTKIMDLVDPTKKMSKSSENPKGSIFLLDSPEDIRKKIMGATTDSECIIKYDKVNKPGISNLMDIVVSLTGTTTSQLEIDFRGKNYGEFKSYVSDVVINHLHNIQTKYDEIMASNQIDNILNDGAAKIREISKTKYDQMKKNMGLYK